MDPDPYDPDSDDDGIIDGLDRDPDFGTNHLCFGQGADASLKFTTLNTITCAASNSVTTLGDIDVDGELDADGPGDLLLIAPTAILEEGFFVEPNGKLSVISTDPTVQIPPP